MRHGFIGLGLVVMLAIAIVVARTDTAIAQTGTTELVSAAYDGGPANGNSCCATASADGRFVAFSSEATNLVANGTTGGMFTRDRTTGLTEQISESTGICTAFGLDGRLVLFRSRDSIGSVFVFDRQDRRTEQVNLRTTREPESTGNGCPTMSADGRFVAFTTFGYEEATGADVLVRDRSTHATESIDPGHNGRSACPFISASGRFVTFSFVSGRQGFIYDRETKRTEPVGETMARCPSVSSDGRFLLYVAGHVVGRQGDESIVDADQVLVRDRQSNAIDRVDQAVSDHLPNDIVCAELTPDARFVVLALGSNRTANGDLFVRDREAATTEQVNLDDGGVPVKAELDCSPSISTDGRFVAFTSARGATPESKSQVFVRDRGTVNKRQQDQARSPASSQPEHGSGLGATQLGLIGIGAGLFAVAAAVVFVGLRRPARRGP